MNLQVLISTMHQNDYSLLKKMNINSNAIVINQTDSKSSTMFKKNNNDILWVNSFERGLSKSRNLAIKKADSNICLLADDDLVYCNNYREIVLETFEYNPKIDIIIFQVEGIEKKFKNYKAKSFKIGYLSSMKVSSVQIAFRLDSIRKKEIKFNEMFGAGAKFKMGEENIFLINCLKNGLNIKYIPKKIANLHIGNSSWFDGFSKEYFISRGASFAGMSKKLSFFLIFQFAIRKYSLYKNSMSLVTAIIYMLKGRQKYLSWENNQ